MATPSGMSERALDTQTGFSEVDKVGERAFQGVTVWGKVCSRIMTERCGCCQGVPWEVWLVGGEPGQILNCLVCCAQDL